MGELHNSGEEARRSLENKPRVDVEEWIRISCGLNVERTHDDWGDNTTDVDWLKKCA